MTDPKPPGGWPLTEEMRRAVWLAQLRHVNAKASGAQPDAVCVALAEERVLSPSQRATDEAAWAALAPFVAARVAEARAQGMREAAGIAKAFSVSAHIAHDMRTGVFPCASQANEAIAAVILAAIPAKEPTT